MCQEEVSLTPKQDTAMASQRNPQYFLSPRLSLQLLALVLTVKFWSVTESAAPTQLRGEVGGNVTFRCPIDKHRTVDFVYFQKGDTFVNGYYASRFIPLPTWENTKIDHREAAVYMYGLNISHSGDYTCLVRYNDSRNVAETLLSLSVTSRYRKPSVMKYCTDDRQGCFVTCSSDGGYPDSKIIWKVAGSENTRQMWRVVNSSEVPSPSTTMFNSSSTTYFNCTSGELKFNCSVGGVVSDELSICTIQVPPELPSPVVIAAAVCVLVIVLFCMVALYYYKTRCTGAAANGNARQDESIALNDNKEGKEAA